MIASSAEYIEQRLVSAKSFVIIGDEYGEYLQSAQGEQSRVIGLLETAHKERKEYEASQVELKRLQAEQAAVAAKQAEEQAKLDADRKAIESERAEASRIMREAKEKAEAKKRKVEADKLTAERAEKERLQAKLDAKEEEENRKEAQEAEVKRQEAMRPDKDKVHSWVAELRFIDGPDGITNKQCKEVVKDTLNALAILSAAAMKQVDSI